MNREGVKLEKERLPQCLTRRKLKPDREFYV